MVIEVADELGGLPCQAEPTGLTCLSPVIMHLWGFIIYQSLWSAQLNGAEMPILATSEVREFLVCIEYIRLDPAFIIRMHQKNRSAQTSRVVNIFKPRKS